MKVNIRRVYEMPLLPEYEEKLRDFNLKQIYDGKVRYIIELNSLDDMVTLRDKFKNIDLILKMDEESEGYYGKTNSSAELSQDYTNL